MKPESVAAVIRQCIRAHADFAPSGADYVDAWACARAGKLSTTSGAANAAYLAATIIETGGWITELAAGRPDGLLDDEAMAEVEAKLYGPTPLCDPNGAAK